VATVGRESLERRGSSDLQQVGRWQRLLIWLVLAIIMLSSWQFMGPFMFPRLGAPPWLYLFVVFSALAVQVAAIIVAILLMVALSFSAARCTIYAIFMLIPCINILVLLSVNSQATAALRAGGLKVGFFGVSEEQAVRILSPDRCKKCGYIIGAIASGTCPECGAALVRP
jgi:hypothetical protein